MSLYTLSICRSILSREVCNMLVLLCRTMPGTRGCCQAETSGVQHIRRRSASGPKSWRRRCLCCTTTVRQRCSTSCWAACQRTAPRNARDRCCWSTKRMRAACCDPTGKKLRCHVQQYRTPAKNCLALCFKTFLEGVRCQADAAHASAPAGNLGMEVTQVLSDVPCTSSVLQPCCLSVGANLSSGSQRRALNCVLSRKAALFRLVTTSRGR